VLASIITSTIEAFRCADVSFELSVPIGTFQVDECTSPVTVIYAERDHVGRLYHQNAPGLSIGWTGMELETVGRAGDVQHWTRLGPSGLLTDVVVRGEGDFPVDAGLSGAGYAQTDQPEPEALPANEELKQKAELKRQRGNEMFRANDFMQAAMEYTAALELDPTISALYANRAQCFLKVGNLEKALEDAITCTEVDPKNPKGWFRKGMSYHAMKQYREAIPALLEAEKLEPTNKQIVEAIKFAQLMARKEAGQS